MSKILVIVVCEMAEGVHVAKTEAPTALTTGAARGVREGSAQKRAAILQAARDLFVAEGFERTSMDAVALRAEVSKRTVYDYYGDKRTLLLAVVEDVAQSLFDSFELAVATHLSDDAAIQDVNHMKAALIGFAMQIATTTIESSDYGTILRLVASERSHLRELQDHPLANYPEDTVAKHLAHFADAGLLEVPNARLAADHFNALTFLLAYNNGEAFGTNTAGPQVEKTIVEGVRAFIRAYSPR